MENIKSTKNTLVNISRVCSIICKIIFYICIVVCALCFIGMVASIFTNWESVKEIIRDNAAEEDIGGWIDFLNVKNALISTGGAFLGMIVSTLISYNAHRFFSKITEEKTPFTEDAVNSLHKIAWLSLVQAIVCPIIMSIIVKFTNTYNLFKSYTEWNGNTVIIALFIFALSLVFKYGVALQKEADTTL